MGTQDYSHTVSMYVWKTKKRSVGVKQFFLALKNAAPKECAPRYWASVGLKINPKETYSIAQKWTKWEENTPMETT